MTLLSTVILSSLLAGLGMTFGAILACFEMKWVNNEIKHGITAFGCGALLSAVALVLVPESIPHVQPMSACLYFIAGGMAFMFLDMFFKKINTPASQLAAMMADFIPESIALGAAFATGSNTAFLLAGLIALQNVPEGFSAYRELNESPQYNKRKILIFFTCMSVLGPISGVSGYLWLGEYPSVIAAVMLFASGGILYSIFQDLAPKAKLEHHMSPPMGAVLGFVFGMLGFMLMV